MTFFKSTLFIMSLIISFMARCEMLRVAAVNFEIKGESNLEQLDSQLELWTKKAKAKGASVILFPELITLDLFSKNPKSSEVSKEILDLSKKSKIYSQKLVMLAKKYKMLLIGATTFVKENTKTYNRAYIIYPSGELKFQDKIYPTPWERKYKISAGDDLKTFNFRGYKFVVLTCHDAEFPSLSQKLTKIRPEIIFVPSQTDGTFGLQRVKRTSQARAIEHMSYVLMTGTSSIPDAPWHTYQGQNFLFTPQNKYFKEPKAGSKTEMLSLYKLDLDKLRTSRRDKKQIYPARDYLSVLKAAK